MTASAFASLGVALLVAYFAGLVVARLRLPRVTGYLLAGVGLGPSGLARWSDHLHVAGRWLLTRERLASLSPLRDLAQSLILLAIGLGLSIDEVRKGGKQTGSFALADVLLAFALTALACAVAVGFKGMRAPLGLGLIAVATAPAATLLVLRELEAEGPWASRVLTLVGINNVVSLLAYSVFLGIAYGGSVVGALQHIGLGALVGMGAGLLAAVSLMQIASPRSFVLLGMGCTLGVWGVAKELSAEPLTAALLFGATLVNASPHADDLRKRLAQVDYPIYVAFFVLAGAELHIDLLFGSHGKALVHAPWPLIAAYVVGRSLGKIASAPVARKLGAVDLEWRGGIGLLAQAGLAISLVQSTMQAAHAANDPSLLAEAELFRVVVLASVIFFELVGPLALRHAAIHSGEVKILNLLPDRISESLGASIVDTLSKLRRSLGLPTIARSGGKGEIYAVDLMRRNFVPIRGDMSVDEVIHTVANAPYDQFPVVDEHDVFQGVISYPAIRDLLFSDELAHESVFDALQVTDGVTCPPEAPLSEVIGIFEECHGEITHMLVVTDEQPPHVIGVIEQRDALAAFHKHR